jgi:hypothetical protein
MGEPIAATVLVPLATTVCSECGILYAVPGHFLAARRGDHRTFNCPNGHEQCFAGPDPDVERRRAEGRRIHEEDQRQAREEADRDVRVSAKAARPFACPVCGRGYATGPWVIRHLEHAHGLDREAALARARSSPSPRGEGVANA